MKYDVFLSYASKDREAVLAIYKALEARGIRTFFDRARLAAGGAWIEDLAEAIRESRAFAVFTAGVTLGRIQRREVQLAFVQHAKRAEAGEPFPLVPVLLDGAAPEVFSGFLELFTWADCRGGAPIETTGFDALVRAVTGKTEAVRQRAAAEVCPFRGLRAFREQDAPWFFGREKFSDRLFALLSDKKLVAVVGPSGSGKSSLVHAGLLPRLRSARSPEVTWEAVSFSPGRRPLHRLALELAHLWLPEDRPDSDAVLEAERIGNELMGAVSLAGFIDLAFQRLPSVDRLLIVVDQFEELFTLSAASLTGSTNVDATAHPNVGKRFVELLMAALEDPRLRVVLTLRADFYGRAVALDRDLSDALADGQVALGPMREDELTAVIEGPARKVGLDMEGGLVERLRADAAGQPGPLPMLEFALTELWQGRTQDGKLTHRAYEALGGIAGAIAERAERVYGGLPREGAAAAAHVLPRMVRVAGGAEEGSDSRQVVSLETLDAAARAVIESFAAARLVVVGRNELTGQETADVAHEALIRDWPRLCQWIDEDRQFLLWRQRLGFHVSEWEAAGRHAHALLRGPQLQEARDWWRQRGGALDARESQFVKASLAAQAGSKALRIVMAASLVAAVVGLAAWQAYLRSDTYQVNYLVEHAPVTQLLNSSFMWSDRRTEVLEDWGRAMARAGRAEKLMGRVDKEGFPSVACMVIAAADELSRRGRVAEGAVLIDRLLKLKPFAGFRSVLDEEAAECAIRTRWAPELQSIVIAALKAAGASLAERADDARESSLEPIEVKLYSTVLQHQLGSAAPDWPALVAELRLLRPNDWTILKAVKLLVTNGQAQAAEALVGEFALANASDYPQRTLRSELVLQLAQKGYIERAKHWASDERFGDEREEGQAILHWAWIAVALARAARADEAIALIETQSGSLKGGDYNAEAEAFATVAAAVAEAGARTGAERLLAQARKWVELQQNDDDTSRALAAIAIAEARLGRLNAARLYADRCTGSYIKLRAYAGILLAAYP
jgi:hypothetical protein